MKVFMSWSGTRSHDVATVFHNWLPEVLQYVKPWLSTDMAKGSTWLGQIQNALAESNGMGLFFLTRESVKSNWVHYEAGGIAVSGNQRVCTVCVDIKPAELLPPLNFFQYTQLEEADVLKLVKSINVQAGEDKRVSDSVLSKAFARAWPDLKDQIDGLPSATEEVQIPPNSTIEEFSPQQSNLVLEALSRIEQRLIALEQGLPGLPLLDERRPSIGHDALAAGLAEVAGRRGFSPPERHRMLQEGAARMQLLGSSEAKRMAEEGGRRIAELAASQREKLLSSSGIAQDPIDRE